MIESFKASMRSTGLEPPEHIEPGRMHRFPGIGKRNGNTSGWCQLFPDGIGGVFGDWATELSETWQAEREQPRTDAERAAFRQQLEQSRKQAEEQRQAEQQQAAANTVEILRGAVGDPSGHPYAMAKKVAFGPLVKRGPWRQRGWNDSLLVPMYNEHGQIVSVQAINPAGDKDFLAGGQKRGCFHPLGKLRGATVTILVGEGLGTIAAAVSATGLPGVVAFDAGNLQAVAEVIRRLAPGAEIVIVADDDMKDGTDRNTGIEAATRAALAVGGWLAVPGLGRKADMWDLWNEQGPEEVREAIANARAVQGEQDKVEAGPTPANEPPATDQEIGIGNATATIQHLASLSPVEYEQARKEAAAGLNMRATVLDRLVNDIHKGSADSDLPFEETSLWPEPIDPALLLSEIAATIQRFIVCSKDVSNAVALWSAMTWFMDSVQVAPLAVITAPEKRCGKTQLLSLLGRLSARSISASSISPAALYRAIDAWKPTLLIDEADAFMKDNEELRGIINSGHTRDSAYVIRTVGENFTPTKFNTWGAKAISGIGHVADTLMDRAVVLELRRKLPHEEVERVRYAEPDLFSNLRSKLARFADDYSERVRLARPDLPPSLNDRAQDNWEPLLAIALVAGGDWLQIGTRAALKLSGSESAAQTIGTELLSDIKEVFEMKGVSRISTADLIKELCADDEKTWATYNRGNPIRPRQLASKLKGYGISSNTVRIGGSTPKGFLEEQFTEAFSRYIPQAPPEKSATAQQKHNFNNLNPQHETQQGSIDPQHATPHGLTNVADKAQRCGYVADRERDNLPLYGDCCGVADRATPTSEGIVEVEI